MKVKRIVLISILFLIAGAAAFGIGMAMLDMDFYALDNAEYKAGTLDLENQVFLGAQKDENGNAEITNVIASINYWFVDVAVGEKFSFEYYTDKDTEVEYSYDNGTVMINMTRDWKKEAFRFDFFKGLKRGKYRCKLTVPSGIDVNFYFTNSETNIKDAQFGEYIMEGTNCDLKFDNVTFGSLSLDAVNSDVEFNNITTGSLACKGTNMDLSADNLTVSADAEIESTNGEFTFENSSVAGKAVCEGTNIELEIKHSVFAAFELEGTNSYLEIEKSKFASVKYSGTNAELVTFGYIDCPLFDLRGTNGDFNITLLGSDADIKSVTVEGTNRTLYVNGDKKRSSYTNSGETLISASGTNVYVDLNFYAK